MSKTEVLSWAEIRQLRAETMLTFMADDIKPFILVALLEDARVTQVQLSDGTLLSRSEFLEIYKQVPDPEDTNE